MSAAWVCSSRVPREIELNQAARACVLSDPFSASSVGACSRRLNGEPAPLAAGSWRAVTPATQTARTPARREVAGSTTARDRTTAPPQFVRPGTRWRFVQFWLDYAFAVVRRGC